MGFGIESFVAFRVFNVYVPQFQEKLRGLNVGIGSQEFDTKLPRCNHFLSFYLPWMKANEGGVMKGPLRQLSEAWGSSDYMSYDIDGRFGALPVDLNAESLSAPLMSSASFVLNLGTSEHVFDQANVWRFMYDHTSVGGFIYNVLPYCGYIDHGLYTYSPAFFVSLAHYNKLRICFMAVSPNSHKNLLVDLGHVRAIDLRKANLVCLLQKTTDKKFEVPIQYNNPMVFDVSFQRLASRGVKSGSVTDLSENSFNVDLDSGELSVISRSELKRKFVQNDLK